MLSTLVESAVFRLRKLPLPLAKVPPLIYVGLYLAAIPAFAAAYYSLPNDLYGPYVRFEYNAWSDSYNIGIMIQNIIRQTLIKRLQQPPLLVDDYEIQQPESVYVQRLTAIDDSKIKFDVYAMVWDKAKKGNIQIPIPVIIDWASRVIATAGSEGKLISRNFRYVELDSTGRVPSDLETLTRSVFKQLFHSSESVFSDELPLIELSNDEEFKISTFFDGLSGNVTSVSGSYWRMFYFSTMVLTTVGFGDIVPMTPLARAVVTGEAILGVIIIGLFLNAIAFRASGRI